MTAAIFRGFARAQAEERTLRERSLLVLTPNQPVIGRELHNDNPDEPCPWCKTQPRKSTDGIYFFVGCCNELCPVQPQVETETSMEVAATMWNTRQ